MMNAASTVDPLGWPLRYASAGEERMRLLFDAHSFGEKRGCEGGTMEQSGVGEKERGDGPEAGGCVKKAPGVGLMLL